MNLKIDAEFQSLIPNMTTEEYAGLKNSLKEEGCRDAIVTWDDIVIDGHNRFAICSRDDISFRTISKSFESRADVKGWIIRNQLGRRNLSAYDRTRLALLLKPEIEEHAKERQGERIDLKSNFVQKSVQSSRTQNEIARLAHVSHDTVHKVETIEAQAAPEQKEAIIRGGKSINKVYQEIKEKSAKTNAKAVSEKIKDEKVKKTKKVKPRKKKEPERIGEEFRVAWDCLFAAVKTEIARKWKTTEKAVAIQRIQVLLDLLER